MTARVLGTSKIALDSNLVGVYLASLDIPIFILLISPYYIQIKNRTEISLFLYPVPLQGYFVKECPFFFLAFCY